LQAQMPSGWWGDFLTTEVAVLHLCEMGLAGCRAVERTREAVLEPTLVNPGAIWEFERADLDSDGKRLARRIVRDKTLHMLCRSSRDENPAVRTFLEQIFVEWNAYLTSGMPLPTADGYAAVCLYAWNDDEFPRVREMVTQLVSHHEQGASGEADVSPMLAPFLYRLLDKWQYLAEPPRLLYELELASALGVTRDLAACNWMLEELEMRQDADGFFRFPDASEFLPSWYFPIEKHTPAEYEVEYTFRAELIFKLLAYDV